MLLAVRSITTATWCHWPSPAGTRPPPVCTYCEPLASRMPNSTLPLAFSQVVKTRLLESPPSPL